MLCDLSVAREGERREREGAVKLKDLVQEMNGEVEGMKRELEGEKAAREREVKAREEAEAKCRRLLVREDGVGATTGALMWELGEAMDAARELVEVYKEEAEEMARCFLALRISGDEVKALRGGAECLRGALELAEGLKARVRMLEEQEEALEGQACTLRGAVTRAGEERARLSDVVRGCLMSVLSEVEGCRRGLEGAGEEWGELERELERTRGELSEESGRGERLERMLDAERVAGDGMALSQPEL